MSQYFAPPVAVRWFTTTIDIVNVAVGDTDEHFVDLSNWFDGVAWRSIPRGVAVIFLRVGGIADVGVAGSYLYARPISRGILDTRADIGLRLNPSPDWLYIHSVMALSSEHRLYYRVSTAQLAAGRTQITLHGYLYGSKRLE